MSIALFDAPALRAPLIFVRSYWLRIRLPFLVDVERSGIPSRVEIAPGERPPWVSFERTQAEVARPPSGRPSQPAPIGFVSSHFSPSLPVELRIALPEIDASPAPSFAPALTPTIARFPWFPDDRRRSARRRLPSGGPQTQPHRLGRGAKLELASLRDHRRDLAPRGDLRSPCSRPCSTCR